MYFVLYRAFYEFRYCTNFIFKFCVQCTLCTCNIYIHIVPAVPLILSSFLPPPKISNSLPFSPPLCHPGHHPQIDCPFCPTNRTAKYEHSYQHPQIPYLKKKKVQISKHPKYLILIVLKLNFLCSSQIQYSPDQCRLSRYF